MTLDVPQELFASAVEMRRDLHRHPELGFAEHRTAGIVATHLRALGIDMHEGIATTGVIGVLRGARPGRTIMLRADMDALPMPEESDARVPLAERGVTHACGHDGHVAILAGGRALLAARRHDIAGYDRLLLSARRRRRGRREAHGR